MPIFNFSYRKVGGLHFIRLGRFGCSFFLSRRRRAVNLHSEDRRYPDGSYMLAPLTRQDSVPSSRYVASPFSYDRD